MKESILDRLTELEIKTAVIFDDEYPTSDPALIEQHYEDDEAWIELLENKDAEILAQFKSEYPDIRRSRGDDRRDYLNKFIGAGISLDVPGSPVVNSLVEELKNWKLCVEGYVSLNDFIDRKEIDEQQVIEKLAEYNLIFLDYDFRGDDGAESNRIMIHLAKMLKRNFKKVLQIPALVLFSAKISQKTNDDKTTYIRKRKFIRQVFDFLPKERIGELTFHDWFQQYLQGVSIGKKFYYLYCQIARDIQQVISEEVMDNLYLVAPATLRVICDVYLEREGITEVEYFTELYLSLINAHLVEDEELVKSTQEFVESTKEIDYPSALDDRAMKELRNRELFNYSVNKFQRPIEFGDIFHFRTMDKFGLIISQSCDLIIRRDGKYNTECVLLLPGRSIRLDPNKPTQRGFTHYFRFGNSDDFVTLEWDFKNPFVVPRKLLDIVSLNQDGEARITIGKEVKKSDWWTDSYSKYINKVASAIQEKVKSREQSWKSIKAVIQENQTAEVSQMFRIIDFPMEVGGETCQVQYPYDVIKSEDNKIITFQINRIARLRLQETLQLQQAYHQDAGRIGISMDVASGEYEEASVRFIDVNGKELAEEVSARKVGDDFIVKREELLQAIQKGSILEAIVERVHTFKTSFNIREIDEIDACQFEFRRKGYGLQVTISSV